MSLLCCQPNVEAFQHALPRRKHWLGLACGLAVISNPSRLFSNRHVLINTRLNMWGRPSVDPLHFSLCDSLRYSVLWTPARLSSLSPQLREFTGPCLYLSSLHYGLETLSRQWAWKVRGLTLFASCLPGITVLHCLILRVFKITIVLYILFIWGGGGGSGRVKIHSWPEIEGHWHFIIPNFHEQL